MHGPDAERGTLMKAQKWEELSKTQRVAYVTGAALFAVLLGSELFSSGSGKTNEQPQKPLILTGAHVSTNRGYAGCRRVEDTDKFTSLLAANDTTAAVAFVDHADCQLLPEGTTGTVEELSAWHASLCIRQRGRPFCSWIPEAIADKVE